MSNNIDNMKSDEQLRRLESAVHKLSESQLSSELVLKQLSADFGALTRDQFEIKGVLFGTSGLAGGFQKGLITLMMEMQALSHENQKSIEHLLERTERESRERELIQETLNKASAENFDKLKRLITIAGGVLTVITLLQVVLNFLLASP